MEDDFKWALLAMEAGCSYAALEVVLVLKMSWWLGRARRAFAKTEYRISELTSRWDCFHTSCRINMKQSARLTLNYRLIWIHKNSTLVPPSAEAGDVWYISIGRTKRALWFPLPPLSDLIEPTKERLILKLWQLETGAISSWFASLRFTYFIRSDAVIEEFHLLQSSAGGRTK